MMKKLFILVAIVNSMAAKSQTSTYHPFPEDSAAWVSDISYNTCFGYCGSVYYEMKGDTFINNNSYNKLFSRGGEFFYITPPPNSIVGATFNTCLYTGAIRQDSIAKKVYFIDSTMANDTLLYDFDLIVGDTIQSWYNKTYISWPLIVSEIDSILINGTYHKSFNFQGYPPGINLSLIEGVGWSGELLGINNASALYVTLACFNGNIITQEAFVNECAVALNCSLLLDINEISTTEHFKLYPNPFSDKLYIEVSDHGFSEFILYDITTRKILQQPFSNNVSLNTDQLDAGIYIYEMRSGDQFIKKGVIIKD